LEKFVLIVSTFYSQHAFFYGRTLETSIARVTSQADYIRILGEAGISVLPKLPGDSSVHLGGKPPEKNNLSYGDLFLQNHGPKRKQ
jgi:hypothetical protein